METRTATPQKDKITITKRNDYTVLINFQRSDYKGKYKTLIEISKDFNPETLKPYRWNKEYSYRLLMDENDTLARWQSKNQAENYTSEKAIKKGIATINRQLRDLKIELAEARLNPLFLKMKIIADEKIKDYYTDFNFHDCLIIHRQKPVNFIWMVRNTGSFLLTKNNSFQNELINGNSFEHDFYYINNGNIKKITQAEANEINKGWKE